MALDVFTILITILEWIKLIIGLFIPILGLLLLLQGALTVLVNRRLSIGGYSIAATEALLGLIIMVIGFYIAGW